MEKQINYLVFVKWEFEKLSDHWSFYKEVKRLIAETKGQNKGQEGKRTFASLYTTYIKGWRVLKSVSNAERFVI